MVISPDQFTLVRFLNGSSNPALLQKGDYYCVVKYIDTSNPVASSLRLASELVGCHVAQTLSVPSLAWRRVSITSPFQRDGKQLPAGLALESRYEPLGSECDENLPEPFWLQEPFTSHLASLIVLDNWIMNRDRPRGGNTLYWGPKEQPSKVMFIDCDRSFVGTKTDEDPGTDRVHWVSDQFRENWLKFGKKKNTSDGTEYDDILSLKEPNGSYLSLKHFKPALRLMEDTKEAVIRSWVQEIPSEWGFENRTKERWVSRFVARRDLVVDVFRMKYGYVPT